MSILNWAEKKAYGKSVHVCCGGDDGGIKYSSAEPSKWEREIEGEAEKKLKLNELLSTKNVNWAEGLYYMYV